MRIAIIGRSEIMFQTMELCVKTGFTVPIIITAPEAPEYTKKTVDFEDYAAKLNAVFIVTSRINTDEIIQELIKAKIDIGLSINFSGIISQRVIDTCRLGILNAHGGDLPRYRGNACQAWAIINGEKEIGLSIYKMKGDYLDGGKIILKFFLPINDDTTITNCWSWFNDVIPSLFVEASKILKKDPTYFLEDSTLSTIPPMRCYPRTPDDGKINWDKTNTEIVRLVNASCEPYSGAFCIYENEKLIIWKAKTLECDEQYLAINGQICGINMDSIDVITGSGKIRVTEVEYLGKRINPSLIIKSIRKRLT